MATVTALADAVVSEINSQDWDLDCVASRAYRPRYDLAGVASIQVTVVPRSLVIAPSFRASDQLQYQIDVAIQKRLEADEEIETMLGLVEAIARHFRLRRPAAMPTAVCVKVENDPIYAVEHLDELRCFTSVLTLSFMIVSD